MNVQVLVSTADRVPIVGASVTADGEPAVSTDATGLVTLSPGSATFTVEASMANYSEQTTTIIQATDGTYSWDDPGTIVSGQVISLASRFDWGESFLLPQSRWMMRL